MVAEQHFGVSVMVSQEEFAKAMKSIENKFVEMERSTSVREMAHSAILQAVRKEITEHAEGVVDQAAVKFTQLEMQTREQPELALRHHPGGQS